MIKITRTIKIILVLVLLVVSPFICNLDGVTSFTVESDYNYNTHIDSADCIATNGARVFVAESTGDTSFIHIFSNAGYQMISEINNGKIIKMQCTGNLLILQQLEYLTVVDLTNPSSTYYISALGISSFTINSSNLFVAFDDRIYETPLSLLSNALNLKGIATAKTYRLDNIVKSITASETELFALFQNNLSKKYIIFPGFSDPYESDSHLTECKIVTFGDSDFWLADSNSIFSLSTAHCFTVNNIKDVAFIKYASNTEVYILDELNNQVHQYFLVGDALIKKSLVLGSNSKNFSLPYTPNGILDSYEFKVLTNDEYRYSPDQIADEDLRSSGKILSGEIVMSLGKTSDTNFELVFYGGKFSIIASTSLKLAVPTITESITMTKVAGSTNQKLFYLPQNNAKFAIHDIPTDTDINLTSRIKDFSGKNWYFATYEISGKTYSGFILESSLANKSAQNDTYILMKADPKIFSKLILFASADENSKKVIEIPSGTDLKVYEQNEKWSKVQVDVDGNTYEGYVLNEYIIKNGTTNLVEFGLVIGLSLVFVALLFSILFIGRKKYLRKQKQNEVYSDDERIMHNY